MGKHGLALDDLERLPNGTYRKKTTPTAVTRHRVPVVPVARAVPKIRGTMNTTETWYYQHCLQTDTQVVSVGYEAMTFTLAHHTPGGKRAMTYTPDFFVEYAGHLEFHEVKARNKAWTSARDDAMAKLKMAAELFPMFIWKLVEIEKGRVTTTTL